MNNRKLAISSLSFQNMEVKDLAAVMKQNGITGLELRLGMSDWSDPAANESDIKKNMDILMANSIAITDLGTSVCPNGFQADALHELEEDMRFASKIHVKGLRIMLGNYRNRWSEKDGPLDYPGLLKWLQEADELAGRYHCEIWIETHNEFCTGRKLHALFQDGEFRHCRILWDVMHPLEYGEPLEETWENVKDYLVHVHIKDGMPWDDPDLYNWKYTEIGKGSIPLEQFVHLLEQHGYHGWFSLEWESQWRDELKKLNLDNGVIIAGYADAMRHL